jgi:hypothetical protein
MGEVGTIVSGGELVALTHSVKAAANENLARVTMTVFADLHYDEPLNLPEGRTLDQKCFKDEEIHRLAPLHLRWKPGDTFKQYLENSRKYFYS